jgi:hypothetical protein
MNVTSVKVMCRASICDAGACLPECAVDFY